MGDPIRIGDFLFHEVDFGLLAACEDGHRAEVWTKPEYEYVNIYLDGFDMGAGKIAMLRKSDNPKLMRMIDSRSILYAIVKKTSETQYTLVFKERTEEDLLAAVASAREVAESSEFQISKAERELKSLAIEKLIARYRPSNSSILCSLRTPAPICIPTDTELTIIERTPEWYAATKLNYVMFHCPTSGASGYVKASLDVRTRIAKAQFNGYSIAALVTGRIDEVQRHGLASIWDEIEHTVEILFRN